MSMTIKEIKKGTMTLKLIENEASNRIGAAPYTVALEIPGFVKKIYNYPTKETAQTAFDNECQKVMELLK